MNTIAYLIEKYGLQKRDIMKARRALKLMKVPKERVDGQLVFVFTDKQVEEMLNFLRLVPARHNGRRCLARVYKYLDE